MDALGVLMNPDPVDNPQITISVRGAVNGIGCSTMATRIAVMLRDAGCEVALMSDDDEPTALSRLVDVQNDDTPEMGLCVQVRDEGVKDHLRALLAQGLGSTLHLAD